MRSQQKQQRKTRFETQRTTRKNKKKTIVDHKNTNYRSRPEQIQQAPPPAKMNL